MRKQPLNTGKAETAKFWLDPDISLEYSYEMSPSELKEIEGIVKERREILKEAWNAYFGRSSGGQKSLV